MFKKILIANRGEIALRVIRTCQEMNIKTIAVFSEVDRNELFVKLADESICIGPGDPQKSYLNYFSIISAAIYFHADAIHPGYGFLSENYYFAKVCEDLGIKFIGPHSETIKLMGNKINSREVAKKIGINIIESIEEVQHMDDDLIRSVEKTIGFPIIIKAANGGGGKGIKIIWNPEGFLLGFNKVKEEARKYFNDSNIFIEKYLEDVRHIEVQILGDEYGNVIHLGDRNCSLQRNNQKVIEECPTVFLNEEVRSKIADYAILIAKAVNYVGVGTIEFLIKDDKIYFLEMNTRIQVEHSVTEEVTGVDLIKEQIKIASGMKLEYRQEDIRISGYSIECRINAEDIKNNYAPSCGNINKVYIPRGEGIRIETSLYKDCIIGYYYDSLIAKIITYGKTREEAIEKMKNVLSKMEIEGVKTNIILHLRIISNDKFISGKYNTKLIEDEIIV